MFSFNSLSKLKRLGDAHLHDTRHKTDLAFIQHRTCAFEKNYEYRTVQFFNKLPKSFTSILDKNKFKKELKQYLISKCFYSVQDFLEN